MFEYTNSTDHQRKLTVGFYSFPPTTRGICANDYLNQISVCWQDLYLLKAAEWASSTHQIC